MALGQKGLFLAAQARSIGASYAQLARAEASGEVRRVSRGVYAFGGAAPSRWEALMAVALVAGPGAVVSHSSAAAVHRFEYGTAYWNGAEGVKGGGGGDGRGGGGSDGRGSDGRRSDGRGGNGCVGARGDGGGLAEGERDGRRDRRVAELSFLPERLSRRAPPGAVVHLINDLAPIDIVERRGIRLTSPCRTFIDLAGRLGPVVSEKLLDEGLIRRRWSVDEISSCLERARRNLPGRSYIARLLALRAEDPRAESALEMKVYRILRTLPPYAAHYVVPIDGHDFVLDAAWPEKKVAAEIVGRSHRVASRSAFDRERWKLTLLAAHGWKVGHITATMSGHEILACMSSLLGLG